MIHREDRELEEKLRSLPVAVPPEELRGRILRTAEQRGTRRRLWGRPLAYALCLVALLALDFTVEHVQSARLSRLVGDGRQAVGTPMAPADMLAAFGERDAMLLAMLEAKEMR